MPKTAAKNGKRKGSPKTAGKNGGEKNRQRWPPKTARIKPPKTADRWTQPNSEDRERSRTRLLLVGIAFLASEGVGDGFEDDLDVEEETPVFYIPDVFLDTFFHHPQFGGFTS